MTFHNKPRASHDIMHHVHESPRVMLVPLFVLAAGAVLSGFIWHEGFVGHDMEAFLGRRRSISRRPTKCRITPMRSRSG